MRITALANAEEHVAIVAAVAVKVVVAEAVRLIVREDVVVAVRLDAHLHVVAAARLDVPPHVVMIANNLVVVVQVDVQQLVQMDVPNHVWVHVTCRVKHLAKQVAEQHVILDAIILVLVQLLFKTKGKKGEKSK